jgi:hypothetical protein
LIRQLKAPVPQPFARFGATVYASPDLTGNKRADIVVGAPGQSVNGLNGAGQAYIYDGAKGRLNKTLTSETPQAGAGYGTALTSVLPAGGSVSIPVVGVPYQDNVNASKVHLQIGQIEISQ